MSVSIRTAKKTATKNQHSSNVLLFYSIYLNFIISFIYNICFINKFMEYAIDSIISSNGGDYVTWFLLTELISKDSDK